MKELKIRLVYGSICLVENRNVTNFEFIRFSKLMKLVTNLTIFTVSLI
jgi:hypothetical protein